MITESIQATAENLRADFLNATTTAERWKVLNEALDWAMAASENADHYRQQAQAKEHTVNLTLDSADLVERVRAQIAEGGLARGPGVSVLVGEKVEGEQHVFREGDTVTWVGSEGAWRFVRHIYPEDAEIREIVPHEARTMEQAAQRIHIVPLSALRPAKPVWVGGART